MSHKLISFSIAIGLFIPNLVLAEQAMIQTESANAMATDSYTYGSNSTNQ